MAENHWKKK